MKLFFSCLAFTLMAASCTTSVTASTTLNKTCADGDDCAKYGGKIQSCCDSANCEYRVNGHVYACNGTDCKSAAVTVTSYCAK